MEQPENVTLPNTEGGILNGIGPLDLPIQVLLVQIMLIQLLVQILTHPLKLIRQPTVIAQIIAGIALGPTLMGRIPGFTAALFHPTAMAALNSIASLGLVFFLLVMGLELDLSLLKQSVLTTSTIAVLGMAIPFGLGAAVSVFLYEQFVDPEQVSFLVFLLFAGVATGITAFPVLASILSELNLMSDRVGIATLGAAALNDVAAWLLLTLCIAVAAAGDLLNIIYIFLMLFGFLVFMGTIMRYTLDKGANHLTKDGILTQTGLLVISMICLGSAWFTSFIGVHAIFGAFVAGTIVPRTNQIPHQITQQLENFVSVILLPLYFAYSGIRTDITKIDSGMAWLGVLLVVVASTVGKVGGTAAAARITGTKSWRECLALGIFMNCKGLVEVIILNIGLDAGVLNDTTFAIMVLMTLITTFATTPLALWVYPPNQRDGYKGIDSEVEQGETFPLFPERIPKSPKDSLA